jgi:CRISPR-associated protein Cst1
MKISLTGNPFVDTGLAVLASKSGCKTMDGLTLEKMKEAHGDGSELARRNSKFKSITIIFTTNSLLTQPSIKPPEKRLQLYSTITTALLNRVGFEDFPERCESCGNPKSLNFDRTIAETLIPLGYKKDEVKYVGRDWFPLAGSIGSDAQALPAGSRAPNLCAKCLFAVHYLPQGVILREGRLSVFQSTSTDFWYDIVQPIADEIDKRIMVGKVEILGAKEGSVVLLNKTFMAMNKLKQMEPGVSLFVWMFSNSGQGPDCKIEEIPNNALQFLFKAYSSGYKEDILRLVSKDYSSENSFFNCIAAGKDYGRLYPSKKSTGVQPDLFVLYQTEICKAKTGSLLAAYKIAQRLKEKMTDTKKYDTTVKEITTNFAVKNKIKNLIVEMIGDGGLSYTEYTELFVEDSEDCIGTKGNSWKYILYFSGNTNWTPDETLKSDTGSTSILQYIARQIFEQYIGDKGYLRFKKEILDRFAIGKIGAPWLRRQFLKNAINCEGFNYGTWQALSSGQNGQENLFEALYRFRLLWTEWLRTTEPTDPKELYKLQNPLGESGLPSEVKVTIYAIVQNYLAERKKESFEKDVINELITGEKKLWWFKQKFVALNKDNYDDSFWEQFLTDNEGYSITSIRLFQLSLELINSYRQQVFKQG